MSHLKYTRAEWSAIADKLQSGDSGNIPPGLAERINALLEATPGSWPEEQCVLELEPATASVVELVRAQMSGVADAEEIVQSHQHGNPTAPYRIEHRTGGIRSVVAYLSDVTTLHRELRRQAARLRSEAATGELVLVDQQSHVEIARQRLLAEPDTGKA